MPDNTNAQDTTDIRATLKEMSQVEFLNLGLENVAYVRAVEGSDKHQAFGIYAADGTPLALQNNLNAAIASALEKDLAPMTVH